MNFTIGEDAVQAITQFHQDGAVYIRQGEELITLK